MRVKPNCEQCKRPYLNGCDGLCEFCSRDRPPKKKLKRLRCLCGKVAVVVVLGGVLTPQDEIMDVEVPLCTACRELELELELILAKTPRQGGPTAAQVIVVRNLPRLKRLLSGRSFNPG